MADPIELLHEISKLMELKGENVFKIRAFDKAAQSLAGREDLLDRARAGTLTELPGVGRGIADILAEFMIHGSCRVRDELQSSLPPGLLELTHIHGLGPKKAMVLIQELGVQSLGELEYACKENRLLKLKGFGPKLQQKILDGITFLGASQGFQRLSDVMQKAQAIERELKRHLQGSQIQQTGSLRRKLEILDQLEFLVETPDSSDFPKKAQQALNQALSQIPVPIPVRLHFTSQNRFGYEWARTTGTREHWQALGNPAPFEVPTEEEFFSRFGLPWIPPEARETGEELILARDGALSSLLNWDGLRGVFHNHTTRSDGVATLEEMVRAAEQRGFEYIGISDHSQSAFYAHGLRKEDLEDQQREIWKVQEKYPKIRVFWGIESDILADGSLDYEPAVLEKFDFVIASIHSRFQMDRKAMTERILKAIQNPCTRFLGHPTGRLLLGRKGYDVDLDLIIQEAARHGVAVELNSNPARLDLDWRWGPQLRKTQAFTSINPDAHEVGGLDDTQYGIAMARKALLPSHQIVNSLNVSQVERWLKRS